MCPLLNTEIRDRLMVERDKNFKQNRPVTRRNPNAEGPCGRFVPSQIMLVTETEDPGDDLIPNVTESEKDTGAA